MTEEAKPDPEDLERLGELESADDLLEFWAETDPPLERSQENRCRHRRFNLQTASRRVFCRDCDQEIDPFEALLVFSAEWDRFKNGLDRLQRKIDAAKGRLDELQRQERNAKARIRRAQRKEG